MNTLRLLPSRSVPRPGEPAPDHKSYEGLELAVVGCMRHLSVEGRRTLAKLASDLEAAEARGMAVLRVHVVTATATNDARG